MEAELAVPPYPDVADRIRFLRDERHHRAEELADALGRRVLLKLQRAEDLALRGGRRGERKNDEIISKAASHRYGRSTRGKKDRRRPRGPETFAWTRRAPRDDV